MAAGRRSYTRDPRSRALQPGWRARGSLGSRTDRGFLVRCFTPAAQKANLKQVGKEFVVHGRLAISLPTENCRLSFVFRMIPAGPEREDICQDVFLKIYQHLSRFRFESSLSTWIGRISYNTCLNYLDKKKLPLYDDLGDENKSFEPVDDEKARPDFGYADKEISGILKGEIEKWQE